ncbi:MAG: hypothetical protein DMG15_02100 [Acidobacteria bacterium]|nr:MAG: hypothetical protein DMG15_02100 [Acidobacteriota bacterium]
MIWSVAMPGFAITVKEPDLSVHSFLTSFSRAPAKSRLYNVRGYVKQEEWAEVSVDPFVCVDQAEAERQRGGGGPAGEDSQGSTLSRRTCGIKREFASHVLGYLDIDEPVNGPSPSEIVNRWSHNMKRAASYCPDGSRLQKLTAI